MFFPHEQKRGLRQAFTSCLGLKASNTNPTLSSPLARAALAQSPSKPTMPNSIVHKDVSYIAAVPDDVLESAFCEKLVAEELSKLACVSARFNKLSVSILLISSAVYYFRLRYLGLS